MRDPNRSLEDYDGAHSRHQWDSSKPVLDPQTRDTFQGLALALTVTFVGVVGFILGALFVWILL